MSQRLCYIGLLILGCLIVYLLLTKVVLSKSNYDKPRHHRHHPTPAEKGEKCQFLHNPKTAGTSIREHINKNLTQCVDYNYHHEFPQDNRITLIRDPFKRFKSAIKYVQKGGHNGDWQYLSKKHMECYNLIKSKKSFSKLLNTGKLEDLCDFDPVFMPQHPWTENSDILCYEDIDQFNDFVGEYCGCSTNNELPEKNTTKDDDSYFDDDDVLTEFVKNKYGKDIQKYQETCSK